MLRALENHLCFYAVCFDRRVSLLVDDRERKVHSTLLSWARDGSASSKEHAEMLQQWMKEGKIFGLSPRGVKVLNAHEQSAHRKRLTEYARNARKRPFRFSFSDTNVFSNLGTERFGTVSQCLSIGSDYNRCSSREGTPCSSR